MARRVLEVVINDDNRDRGKTFVITEMAATQGEKWAIRVVMALMQSGLDVPDDYKSMGMSALASIGIRALSNLRFDVAEPLLDEMLACVKIKPSPDVVRDLIEQDIEEIGTRLKLRVEVGKLHLDFLMAASTLLKT